MEKHYRRLVRKVKYFLLTEIRKKSWWSKLLAANVFDARFWSWERGSVARAAGWGSMAAISPLPVQTFWAILACLWRKGNVPVGVLMAWLSPPGFTFFAIPAQWFLGNYVCAMLGFEGSGAKWAMLEQATKYMSLQPLDGLNLYMIGVEFFLGWILSSIVVGFLCYGIVNCIWLGEMKISAWWHRRKNFSEGNAE